MEFRLFPHPQTPCPEVSAIGVNIVRNHDRMELNWRIEGDIVALTIPATATPARTDGLWQHLCVELFVRDANGPGYTEYNFAPSGQWAAYRFDDYRAGMRELNMTDDPAIAVVESANALAISVALKADIAEGQAIALSVVIETKNGDKSYWALAHPTGEPDFHHADCFIGAFAATDLP